MSAIIDKLRADVAALQGTEASAVALLGGLKKALDDALASGDTAALEQLSKDIEAGTAGLASAVAENQPPGSNPQVTTAGTSPPSSTEPEPSPAPEPPAASGGA